MVDEVMDDLEGSFEATIEALQRDLTKVRTGRANPAMLDGVKVDYYGTPTPLNQVGAIKVPDPRMITIQPWEKSMIGPVEKAVLQSDLGLNPTNDGTLIRVPIPPLTGERRKELTRQVRDLGEKAKIAVRNHRRDANEMIKTLEKDGELSEDLMHRNLAEVQEKTKEATSKIDAIVEKKEGEIMEV